MSVFTYISVSSGDSSLNLSECNNNEEVPESCTLFPRDLYPLVVHQLMGLRECNSTKRDPITQFPYRFIFISL